MVNLTSLFDYFLGKFGKHLGAQLVLTALAMLDVCPFGVTGHEYLVLAMRLRHSICQHHRWNKPPGLCLAFRQWGNYVRPDL